jgi:hypothetical protein
LTTAKSRSTRAKIAVTGKSMIDAEVEYRATPGLTASMIRAQLDLLVRDDGFRSSKRSVAFLKYVVEQTLNGSADQIKERTIGVEVFERDPNYDTNVDHIVRTAATELRKRLATYYVDEKHRSELRIELVPGSYVPRFAHPGQARHTLIDPEAEATEAGFETHSAHIQFGPLPLAGNTAAAKETPHWGRRSWGLLLIAAFALAVALGYSWLHKANPEDMFWRPVVDTPGPVLVAVGDHPNGPPTVPAADGASSTVTPVPSSDSSQTVPFADTVTIARVVGAKPGTSRSSFAGAAPARFPISAKVRWCLLAPSIMNGVCVLPASSVTAWPWTPTGTLSIFGTRKTPHHATGAGPPISLRSRSRAPTVPSCRTSP